MLAETERLKAGASSLPDLHDGFLDGILLSKDKNTWALNYHETSNYDGVDLILGVADRVLLVCDLWNQVRDVVVKKGILGPEPLDVVKLTVISVSNRELTCDLYVRSARSKAEHERKLIISIDASIDRVSLAVK